MVNVKKEHKAIQESIKRKYSDKFIINCEAIDGKNYLPNKESCAYQPDVVIKSKIPDDILYIIEVECDPVRKVLVGASVLADYSISQMKLKTKPVVIFIVYTEQGIKQIHNFKERIKIAKQYCKNIKEIMILSDKEFEKYSL